VGVLFVMLDCCDPLFCWLVTFTCALVVTVVVSVADDVLLKLLELAELERAGNVKGLVAVVVVAIQRPACCTANDVNGKG